MRDIQWYLFYLSKYTDFNFTQRKVKYILIYLDEVFSAWNYTCNVSHKTRDSLVSISRWDTRKRATCWSILCSLSLRQFVSFSHIKNFIEFYSRVRNWSSLKEYLTVRSEIFLMKISVDSNLDYFFLTIIIFEFDG